MSQYVQPLPARLSVNKYETDEGQPHIVLDQQRVAEEGVGDLLIRICPAHVYSRNADGTIGVEYAACLECGTCFALGRGAVSWHYPDGGMGISYREG
ncbi:MAG: 4Fe-4S dicluster domain-containing protein [Actinomycetaceae bacterium]|nr:4Fe-4S dicluster domain-containing protein [Actinomycetaceae bacterium]